MGSRKGFLERTDIIASGDTMLEGHGVDHLARREHVGLKRLVSPTLTK